MGVAEGGYSHGNSKPDPCDEQQGCILLPVVVRTAPGASAREAWKAARRRRRAALLALAAVAAATAAFQWWVVAAAAGGALWWFASRRHDADRWLRGAEGEESTAELLRRLPRRRWHVRHDLRIPGSRANLDHVVIGRTGVWLVDTKTTRLPVTTRWGRVRVGGRPLQTGSTVWEATVLSDRLGWPVRPLIALHGPGLRRRGGRAGGVPVVPATTIRRRLRRGRRRLSSADAAILRSRLDRFGD